MGAALTVVTILAVSVMVVRIASVAMRQTGLPDNVARFQSMSALTGTGFTTSETEMIVNYPIRRKIVVALMIFGNLGLVSVSSTFIVAFVGAGSGDGSIIYQIFAFALAIGFTIIIVTNKTLDDWLCGIVGKLLEKAVSLEAAPFHKLLQLDDSYSLAEVIYEGEGPLDMALPGQVGLTALAVREPGTRRLRKLDSGKSINTGEIVLLFGPQHGHEAFQSLIRTGSGSAVQGEAG